MEIVDYWYQWKKITKLMESGQAFQVKVPENMVKNFRAMAVYALPWHLKSGYRTKRVAADVVQFYPKDEQV